MNTSSTLTHLKRLTGLVCIAFLFLACLPADTARHETAAKDLLQFTAAGHILGFDSHGMYAATSSHALHVKFLGGRTVSPVAAAAPADGNRAAPLGQVTYTNLWPGIDLVYSAAAGGIYTTTYRLASGADPGVIRLAYNASIHLDGTGALQGSFETGSFSESPPRAWQEIAGHKIPVKAAFRARGREVSFTLGAYDPAYPLVIDPTLTWNTFLGGSGSDFSAAIAVDDHGSVYVAGASSASWGVGPILPHHGKLDMFVARLFPDGTRMWNTFLGGSNDDLGYGIAIDETGNAYVIGASEGSWGSPVRAYSALSDAFVARLNPDGVLAWNTFLGGSDHDSGYAISLDGSGNVFLAGSSDASWGSPVRGYTGSNDCFAAKLSFNGGLAWNTFLGSSLSDYCSGIAVHANGNVYVTGTSFDTWGIGPIDPYVGSGDAFAAALQSNGERIWSTFLGGSDWDIGEAIAVDTAGNVFVAGYSQASWGASPVRPFSGTSDAFVARLSPTGARLWNTFLGGNGGDGEPNLSLHAGNIFVVGVSTTSWGNPLQPYTADNDCWVVQLIPNGGLGWNTFFGGSATDDCTGIAVQENGDIFAVGESNGSWGSPVRAYAAGWDAFVVKLSEPVVIPTRIFLPLIVK